LLIPVKPAGTNTVKSYWFRSTAWFPGRD